MLVLFSDNAKNFMDSIKELKRLLNLVKTPDNDLSGYLRSKGVNWKFIPSSSIGTPDFGGHSESGVILNQCRSLLQSSSLHFNICKLFFCLCIGYLRWISNVISLYFLHFWLHFISEDNFNFGTTTQPISSDWDLLCLKILLFLWKKNVNFMTFYFYFFLK